MAASCVSFSTLRAHDRTAEPVAAYRRCLIWACCPTTRRHRRLRRIRATYVISERRKTALGRHRCPDENRRVHHGRAVVGGVLVFDPAPPSEQPTLPSFCLTIPSSQDTAATVAAISSRKSDGGRSASSARCTILLRSSKRRQTFLKSCESSVFRDRPRTSRQGSSNRAAAATEKSRGRSSSNSTSGSWSVFAPSRNAVLTAASHPIAANTTE